MAAASRSAPRYRRVRGGASRPVVVTTLIGVNVAVFALTAVLAGSVGDNASSGWFYLASLLPADVAAGQWWRLVTAGFLHVGPLHLAFNMIALWVIGSDLERVLGPLRFAVLYGVSLLGGSTAVMLFAPPGGAVAGASGAVFGLMGALAVMLRRSRLSAGPALTTIALNVGLSFLIPGLSLAGHLGGLVAGTVTTLALVDLPPRSRPVAGYLGSAAIAVVLLAAVGLRAANLY